MISSRIFRKHYLITAVTILLFLVLGIMSNIFIIRVSEREEAPRMKPPTATFIARVMDMLDQGDPAEGLQRIEALNERALPFVFTIYNDKGEKVAGGDPLIVPEWSAIQKPGHPYDSIHIGDRFRPGYQPPLISSLFNFTAPPAQGASCDLIHLKNEAHPHYLYACVERQGAKNPPINLIFLSIGVLVFSTLMGAGVSLLYIFSSFGKKALLLDGVMSEFKRGNLKARIPITRKDEVGQAMQRFNLMAEELERLVDHLKSVERSRVQLLQELTHDLRTPVASLKNLLETLSVGYGQITDKVREEIIHLTLHEVDYFERLIEDLLVLAQVSEPRYQAGREPVFLDGLLAEESEIVLGKELSVGRHLGLKSEIQARDISFLGDRTLLKRLFRNALENAFSFARHEVKVTLRRTDKGVEIMIDDDGPGFNEAALRNFGVRRSTREIGTQTSGGRLSVGLGSVIMKTVAEIHQGSVDAGNRTDVDGKIIGGRITLKFVLPTKQEK